MYAQPSSRLEYLKKHPFDFTSDDEPVPYLLTSARGRANKMELQRPITFEWSPSERQAIRHPLLFVGKYARDLSKIPAAVRGGELEFEVYLFWNSKVMPKENNGVLVRSNGASGALNAILAVFFDDAQT